MSIANNKGSEARRLEKKRKGGFWLRKWDSIDVAKVFLVLGMHVLAACAPFMFNWGAIWVALVMEVVTGLGVTIGYHRLLTHKSFKIPKWLEYIIVYCGAQSGEGEPIYWVSVHKNHHKYVDTEKDPHTPPKEGFWGCERRCLTKVTYFVNSVCHTWGERPWNTSDTSTNNWWVAILTFGEGWHNNHHAFPKSARHGIEWWQLDVSWEIIKFLETIGLATDIKLPTEADKEILKLRLDNTKQTN
ncbi:fatty acid desaturase, type 1 protein [Tanacetum coccineum]